MCAQSWKKAQIKPLDRRSSGKLKTYMTSGVEQAGK